jgi:hypothetical protein
MTTEQFVRNFSLLCKNGRLLKTLPICEYFWKFEIVASKLLKRTGLHNGDKAVVASSAAINTGYHSKAE